MNEGAHKKHAYKFNDIIKAKLRCGDQNDSDDFIRLMIHGKQKSLHIYLTLTKQFDYVVKNQNYSKFSSLFDLCCKIKKRVKLF